MFSKATIPVFLCFIVIAVNGQEQQQQQQQRPLVIFHGLGDVADSIFSLRPLIKHIERKLPGIYVHSLNIGLNPNATDSGFISQFLAGWTVNANKQVQRALDIIAADPRLANGYNSLGFSQGGQFLRAVVQRTPESMSAKTFNYVSLGGQHQGVFGFPDTCNFGAGDAAEWPLPAKQAFGEMILRATAGQDGNNSTSECDFIRNTLSLAAYEPWAQHIVTPSNYWHDPLHEQRYLSGCTFLPDINNGNSLNESYRQRILALNKMVLVKFENDTIVVPRESEWFGFYAPDQDVQIQTVFETELYQKDLIGLKQLNERGDLVFLQTPGEHLQFTMSWFDENILPFLNNTITDS